MATYKVLKDVWYEPKDKDGKEIIPSFKRLLAGTTFTYPNKTIFPTNLPIDWFLEDNVIELVP